MVRTGKRRGMKGVDFTGFGRLALRMPQRLMNRLSAPVAYVANTDVANNFVA
jgi:hypothetical protein